MPEGRQKMTELAEKLKQRIKEKKSSKALAPGAGRYWSEATYWEGYIAALEELLEGEAPCPKN